MELPGVTRLISADEGPNRSNGNSPERKPQSASESTMRSKMSPNPKPTSQSEFESNVESQSKSDSSSVTELERENELKALQDDNLSGEPTEPSCEKGTRLGIGTSGEGGGKRETKEVSKSATIGERSRGALGGLGKSLAVTLEDQKQDKGNCDYSDESGSTKGVEKDSNLRGVGVRSPRAVENDPQLECTLGTLKAVHRAFFSAAVGERR